jgi:serine/threonine-protein kinase
VTQEASATVAKGIVIRTDPAQGTLVDAGTPITIFVSSGPAPVVMPNVKGLSETAARDALAKLGLTATIEFVDLAAGDSKVGKVIAQDTAAASMVNPGTAIVLTVGRDTSVTVPPAG